MQTLEISINDVLTVGHTHVKQKGSVSTFSFCPVKLV